MRCLIGGRQTYPLQNQLTLEKVVLKILNYVLQKQLKIKRKQHRKTCVVQILLSRHANIRLNKKQLFALCS